MGNVISSKMKATVLSISDLNNWRYISQSYGFTFCYQTLIKCPFSIPNIQWNKMGLNSLSGSLTVQLNNAWILNIILYNFPAIGTVKYNFKSYSYCCQVRSSIFQWGAYTCNWKLVWNSKLVININSSSWWNNWNQIWFTGKCYCTRTGRSILWKWRCNRRGLDFEKF